MRMSILSTAIRPDEINTYVAQPWNDCPIDRITQSVLIVGLWYEGKWENYFVAFIPSFIDDRDSKGNLGSLPQNRPLRTMGVPLKESFKVISVLGV